NDLVCQIPIHFTQAALGAEIEVPTLDGRERLVIPRGTQSGEVFRLRLKGIPDVNGRGRGDELIEVVVETPRHLTPRQEELLRALAELDHDAVMPRHKSFFEKFKSYFTEPDEQGNTAEGG
ncbi:MAG: DnaJ C-terminal domain-containing protein, partial [Planctomycetaceae bacterium]